MVGCTYPRPDLAASGLATDFWMLFLFVADRDAGRFAGAERDGPIARRRGVGERGVGDCWVCVSAASGARHRRPARQVPHLARGRRIRTGDAGTNTRAVEDHCAGADHRVESFGGLRRTPACGTGRALPILDDLDERFNRREPRERKRALRGSRCGGRGAAVEGRNGYSPRRTALTRLAPIETSLRTACASPPLTDGL